MKGMNTGLKDEDSRAQKPTQVQRNIQCGVTGTWGWLGSRGRGGVPEGLAHGSHWSPRER